MLQVPLYNLAKGSGASAYLESNKEFSLFLRELSDQFTFISRKGNPPKVTTRHKMASLYPSQPTRLQWGDPFLRILVGAKLYP